MPRNANNSQRALQHPPARKFNSSFPSRTSQFCVEENFPARVFFPFNVPSQLNLRLTSGYFEERLCWVLLVTRNEIGKIYIGLPVQDFKIISTHSLIRETKQMQSSIKKSGWIIDHLKIFWCAVSLSRYLQDFYKSKS